MSLPLSSPSFSRPSTDLPSTDLPSTDLPSTNLPSSDLPSSDLPSSYVRMSVRASEAACWQRFDHPVGIVTTSHLNEVADGLRAVEEACQNGLRSCPQYWLEALDENP